jgi:hypothetical protein
VQGSWASHEVNSIRGRIAPTLVIPDRYVISGRVGTFHRWVAQRRLDDLPIGITAGPQHLAEGPNRVEFHGFGLAAFVKPIASTSAAERSSA